MEGTEVRQDPGTRRAFLRTSGLTFVGGSAMLSSACGDVARKTSRGGGGGTSDADILNQALDLENTAVAMYTVGAGMLTRERLTLARRCLEQEKEHAAGLEEAIEQMGARRTYQTGATRTSSGPRRRRPASSSSPT